MLPNNTTVKTLIELGFEPLVADLEIDDIEELELLLYGTVDGKEYVYTVQSRDIPNSDCTLEYYSIESYRKATKEGFGYQKVSVYGLNTWCEMFGTSFRCFQF